MSESLPNPGHGYVVREQLGRGRWKEVYRAVVRGEWHDRALARFIETPEAEDLFDELKYWIGSHREPGENIALVYNAFKGDDGKFYLVEELLYRSLEAIAPLKVVDGFLRIARDLSCGLTALHKRNKVHRDLKLDNCGVDHLGVAKIFDLGSATSEGGDVSGSILSRAPELFVSGAKCTKESDVWALGAVLFALRSGGDYPFVEHAEVKTKPTEGEPRARFEAVVASRVCEQWAADRLNERLEAEFANGSRKLLSQMLDFDPKRRPTAKYCAEEWEHLLKPWMTDVSSQVNTGASVIKDIEAFLKAVLQGTAGISSLQWERVSLSIDRLVDDKTTDPEAIEKLTALRQQVVQARNQLAV
jgi:serine/threonine protein kinase